MSYLPIFFNTSGIKFLVIGSGQIALSKIETILDFSGSVVVVSPDKTSKNSKAIQQLAVKFICDSYDEKYLTDADVVIAATDDKTLNKKISDAAMAQKKLANAVDNPSCSNFIFGAYVKQGKVTVSSSTSGSSPVLARFLKEKISNILPQNLDALGEFAEKNREIIKEKFSDLQARRLFWSEIIEGVIGAEIFVGNSAKAQKLFAEKLQNSSNRKTAAVYFIGAGCGDPELITLKAIKLLAHADVVLYDRLVAKEILAYARKDAVRINVGKTKDFHLYTQEQINQLIVDYASQGNIVARLKGGDPAIFAHLGEEISAIAKLKIPYQIVPGVGAASGASAYAGIPLTSRVYGKAVRFLTIYQENLVDDSYWKNLAGTTDTLVLYMSSRNLKTITEKLLQFGQNPKTPLVVIEQATTPFQKNHFTTIENFSADFGDKKFISPSITIIGEVANKELQHQWLEVGKDGEFFPPIGKK